LTGLYDFDKLYFSSHFAAMALLVALPVSVVYLVLQKYIVGGLTIGSVK
jgi:arabinogalactan oligomer/maltooligosaccharide transport system permease protein